MAFLNGFTLIELIVVIVIIGILAAIVIPRLSGFTGTAQEKAAVADARTILTALTALYAEENSDAAVVSGAALLNLTGPIDGTFTDGPSSSGGAIDFTYKLENATVVVEDGSITTP